jgi:leader peptidase (prepilin peptidase)/N-methyltransferase
MRIAIGAAAVLAAVVAVWRLGGSWALVPYLGLVGVGAVLADTDLREHRLPNRLVLPAIGASVLLLLGASLLDGELERWPAALLGGAALFGLYLVLALVSPAGMGMGDVKLAALIGVYAGYQGLSTWLLAAFAGFLVGALVALAGMAFRRLNGRSSIPFGPFMLAGFWIALALAEKTP